MRSPTTLRSARCAIRFGRPALAWLVVVAGCGDTPPPVPPPPVTAPAPDPEPPAWAKRVEMVPDADERARSRWPVRPAVMSDASEASDERVVARRLVYRVGFAVPPGFRAGRPPLIPNAAELEVDLSRDRLRARFVGAGWPLPKGVEVRLRADLPGVYVFDDRGGRSLHSGELASWFEGRTGGSQSRVRVRRETAAHTSGPSEPICMLLAEWTRQPREDIARRCSDGSIPPSFAFGPWRGELTAMVPTRLPRRALRADHADPPAPIARTTNGLMVDPDDLGDLALVAARPAASTRGTLTVDNHGDGRAVLVIDGTPIGWLDAATSTTLGGLPTGTHRVGALRPLGVARVHPRPTSVPGTFEIGRPAKGAPAED